MNTVIMMKYHEQALWKLRKRHWLAHAIGILFTLSVLTIPYLCKLDRDIFSGAYGAVRLELGRLQAKQRLLGILRSRALTLGQAMDIADVVLSQNKVPVPMALALIETESSFNPDAVSEKGARGLGQLMPMTAKTYAGNASKNIHDPVVNTRSSLTYLSDLKQVYGSWPEALRSYNGGPSNRYNRALDGYVKTVLARAERYGGQLGE